MGVMMAKKTIDNTMVLTLSRARRTQYQSNFSSSTVEAALAPWASSRIRAIQAVFSSGVKNLMSLGVCGRKKMVANPKTTVMAPSTKKMKGCMVSRSIDEWNEGLPSHCTLGYESLRDQLQEGHRKHH